MSAFLQTFESDYGSRQNALVVSIGINDLESSALRIE